MQMNLFENIKIFIEIVDAGSFAQAAENLQIHRPAVTKALQQLEQESGVRLLQRTTRRLYLTPEGEEFYRRSKPLLSQADDLLESFAPDRPIRGQLRVDMPIAFARLLVIPHLVRGEDACGRRPRRVQPVLLQAACPRLVEECVGAMGRGTRQRDGDHVVDMS